jgi:hypothetical protein
MKDTRLDNSLQSVLQTVIIDFQLRSQSVTLVMPSCVYSLVSFTHDCFVEHFMLSLPNISFTLMHHMCLLPTQAVQYWVHVPSHMLPLLSLYSTLSIQSFTLFIKFLLLNPHWYNILMQMLIFSPFYTDPNLLQAMEYLSAFTSLVLVFSTVSSPLTKTVMIP